MAYEKKVCAAMPDGQEVAEYILTNEHGVSASFLNLGGIWKTMKVPDREGKRKDVVLGYDTVDKWLKGPGHCGEIVGRNANRIGGAAFEINGITYRLSANSGENNLHSGPDYYGSRIWNAEAEETGVGTRVTFSLESPHMDQGYPGNAKISVSYTLTDDNSLMITYQMIADEDTIANFTNHAYFNLAGHDAGSILDQKVWIDADTFTIADKTSIPTGELVPVRGTPMDFTQWKAIGQDIGADYEPLVMAGGYDHNWVLNHKAGELSLSAKAKDEKSGRVLEVFTDLPGIQFYTANSFKPPFAGKDGVCYQGRQGYCFETQYYPDAVNKPQFPSPLLKAGEEYMTTTVYRFSVEK